MNSANTIAEIIRALYASRSGRYHRRPEMRDSDTVEAALRATESGHLVITVHSVDALHTLDRIDGFLTSAYRTSGLYILGHALVASLSQRLVKTVCPACHTTSTAFEVFGGNERCADIGIDPNEVVALTNREGCDLCNHTGFLGRTLSVESMFPPEDLASRRAIAERLMVSERHFIDRRCPRHHLHSAPSIDRRFDPPQRHRRQHGRVVAGRRSGDPPEPELA